MNSQLASCVTWAVALSLPLLALQPGHAEPPPEKSTAKAGDGQEMPAAATPAATTSSGAQSAAKPGGGKSKYPAFSELLDDAEVIHGMLKLYRKDAKLYAELPNTDMNRDFIVVIAIARGIGRHHLLGGMSWGSGDDWLWQFRRADDRVQIVRRNVRFRAAKGTPQEKAVHIAYTDSVLFSLPTATLAPGGATVVDLTPVFMSDLPQISSVLKGFAFSAEKSTWASVKAFRDNVEIEVAATYTSSGAESLDTVADSRGATINVHYSISRLSETGYEPRLADDRVGYFVTAVKDFTKATDHDRFVRYVNRWDLRKADPSAEVSPPKTPIIFWLEKTIPYKYRAPIREGILEWNKAFEKAGFVNAVEVRQQPNDAEWDPEDINYNTFRWITSSAGMAMGPSRVNPITGQILDADIILDADFIQFWKEHYESDTAESRAAASQSRNVPLAASQSRAVSAREPLYDGAIGIPSFGRSRDSRGYRCECASGMAHQLAFGALLLAPADKPASKEVIEQLIMEGVKSIAVHEVGHTLGLRHNFKASAYLSLEEMADAEKTRQTGLAASVMDYLPINIAPKGQKQGPYFDTVIGPYDYWAIEYGYRPFSGGADGELPQLRRIASRDAEPALQYGTDENARPSDPDPLCVRYDLGNDPVKFARRQAQLVAEAWPNVVDRLIDEGEGYQRARRALNILLSAYGNAMGFVAKEIGGIYVYRDHRGDPNARPPFVLVDAKKQREAMDLLQQQILNEEALQFPPKLYNYLAPSFWNHWGIEVPLRVDFPIHDVMAAWQDRVLGQLLSPVTLSRLVDDELKVPADQDAFTAAELIERLTAAVFSETQKLQAGEFSNRKPGINSLRRSLQRRYVERLADLAMGNAPAPADCQSAASAELEALEARIKQVLAGKAKLDSYTRSHLSELSSLIRKVLDARLQLRNP